MSKTILVIDDAAIEKLQALRFFAENNVLSTEYMQMLVAANTAVGNNPRHRCTLHHCFQVVFSVENHFGKVFRHLSVSINETGLLPSKPPPPRMVAEIAKILGFNVNPKAEKEEDIFPFCKIKGDEELGMKAPNIFEVVGG